MLYFALKMLMADRAKYTGLLIGIAFTAFLVTFAAAYFCGFMTRGFALIAENNATNVWVMDPSVESAEQTINIPANTLNRVRSVEGVQYAVPMALGSVDARFPNGGFQSFQVIGVDDATMIGSPSVPGEDVPTLLHQPDAAIADSGGTSGKLITPKSQRDQWPHEGPHLLATMRPLAAGDELLANDTRIMIAGVSQTLPRFPPRPLLYMTYANAARILPQERNLLTFVLVKARADIKPEALAKRIELRTGLRARSSDAFKEDTVRWYLANSEDVGDMAAMLTLAMTVGFGVSGVLLYMFTYENLKQYAVLNVMGAMPRTMLAMIFMQSALCALIGTGLGLGACAIIGEIVAQAGYPFRMLWFTPLVGIVGVLFVSLMAAAISARPVLRLQPAAVFAGR